MKKLALSVAAVCLTSLSAAQFSVNIGGQVGLPQDDFKEQTSDWLPGIAVNGGYLFPGTPLWLGAELNVAFMGRNARNVPWSSTIPDVTLKVETDHTSAQILALARIMPLTGNFSPYIEGFIGPQIFSSTTTVSSPNTNDGEAIASNGVHEDTSLAYGLGLGTSIQLLPSSGPDDPAMGLFLAWRYSWGGESEYLTAESVIQNGNEISYAPKTSLTNQQLIQFGVNLGF